MFYLRLVLFTRACARVDFHLLGGLCPRDLTYLTILLHELVVSVGLVQLSKAGLDLFHKRRQVSLQACDSSSHGSDLGNVDILTGESFFVDQ